MSSDAIFWLQLVVGLGVFTLMAAWYVWPRLVKLPLASALAPLLWVQVFRYVGMTLLVKGMIDPNLSQSLLKDGAYGDLLAAALAFASIVALRFTWRYAVPLVWVANLWGFLDLLNVVRGVITKDVPSYHLESIWYIYTFYAPLVVVSAVMIFIVLLKAKSWKRAPGPEPVTAQG